MIEHADPNSVKPPQTEEQKAETAREPEEMSMKPPQTENDSVKPPQTE
ncbi:MAG: hypothetical protein WAM85_10260 [Terracidiphilus sp.]